MNKDQLMGLANHAMGQMQEQMGILIGNRDQQMRGRAKQFAGTARRCSGEATQIIKNVLSRR